MQIGWFVKEWVTSLNVPKLPGSKGGNRLMTSWPEAYTLAWPVLTNSLQQGIVAERWINCSCVVTLWSVCVHWTLVDSTGSVDITGHYRLDIGDKGNTRENLSSGEMAHTGKIVMCMYVCMYTRMYLCVYVCVYMYNICMHMPTHICAYTHTCAHTTHTRAHGHTHSSKWPLGHTYNKRSWTFQLGWQTIHKMGLKSDCVNI